MTTDCLMKSLVLGSLITLLAACAAGPSQAPENSGFASCPEPRPEMCTQEYRPVCGHIDTQLACASPPCSLVKHRSYSNPCQACSDPSVMAYELGSCESFGKGAAANQS